MRHGTVNAAWLRFATAKSRCGEGPVNALAMTTVTTPASTDTLFISIASYCDPLLEFTLRSALTQASHPERLRFGIVEQQVADACITVPEPWRAQVRRVHINPLDARGPCWARAIGMSLYQGERWFLQIDSHTWFEPGWDDRLIRWGEACQALNPRCLITAYPNAFRMVDGTPTVEMAGHKVLAHVVAAGQQFAADHPVLMFEGVPVESDQPVYGMHVAAGCLFAPGTVVNALPYDPFLYFHGEEQSFALRAWTAGWDIFHIPAVPLYHHYVAAQDTGRPMHWAPEIDAQRVVRWGELAALSNQRLRALLWGGADLGLYGLGSARSLAEYAAFSDIDYPGRQINPQAYKARFGY